MSENAAERRAGFVTGVSLLIPVTLSAMAVILLAPVLPQLMEEFKDAPNADYLVPLVLTMPALCIAILSPVAGAMGDYFGRRKLLMISLCVYGAVGIAPLFLSDLTHILISRIGVGIAEALILVLSTTMIADYFSGESRNRWLAGQLTVASLSALLFFNIGGVLGGFGWRTPFWVYLSAIGMMLAVMAFTWEQGKKDPAENDPAGPAQRLGNLSWAGFPWARMSGILVITTFAAILFYVMQIHAASGVAAHGVRDPAKIGFLTSIVSIGVPVGSLLYRLISRAPIAWQLLIEFLALGCGFVLMSAATSLGVYLAACALNQLAAGLVFPTMLVWAMAQLHYEVRARGAGLSQAALALGQFLCPIAVTFFSLRAGGLLQSFQYIGACSLLAALGAAAAILYPRLKAARR